jgi:hypothetical protein
LHPWQKLQQNHKPASHWSWCNLYLAVLSHLRLQGPIWPADISIAMVMMFLFGNIITMGMQLFDTISELACWQQELRSFAHCRCWKKPTTWYFSSLFLSPLHQDVQLHPKN